MGNFTYKSNEIVLIMKENWINIEENNPQIYQRCLFYSEDRGGLILHYGFMGTDENGCFIFQDIESGGDYILDHFITHWIPILDFPIKPIT